MPRFRIINHPLYIWATEDTFLPTDIDGLKLWLDSNDISTLFQDAAKATPITTDGQTVGAWVDKSGNGYDVTQSTAANEPTYKTGIQNGLPVLRFDGTNDNLRNASDPAITQPLTKFVVAKYDNVDTALRYVIESGSSTARGFIRTTSGNWLFYAGSVVTDGADDGDWHIFTVLFNGASSLLRIDGAEVQSGDAGAQDSDGTTVGASNNGTGGFWDGDTSEVLVYSGDQTANFSTIESYLADKWNITLG